jgi:hypothetical protein
MVLSITVPGVSADVSKPMRKRDALVRGDNDGVRFLFDIAFRWCYEAGTAVASGKPVKDMAERNNSQLVLRDGNQSVALVGNGLDFSESTLPGNFIQIPAAVWADLAADQEFLICMYLTPPIASDFPSSLKSIMQGSQGLNSYVNEPDICLIALTGTTFSIRRQTAINAVSTLTLGLAGAAAYGVFSQLAVWRTATEYGARLKTATGQVVTTAAAGAKNTANIAAASGAMGVARGFWTNSALTTDERKSVKFKLHRGFVENLHRSGRDPVDLLDADWARTIARNVF